MRLFRPSGAAMKMVFATPAGESHEFGILAAATLASMAGVEPVYLGPNLPAEDIAAAAERTGAKVIVLGIAFPAENRMEEVKAIAAVAPETAELWIGGAGGGDLDLAVLGRRIRLLKDLPAFENECRRWRD